MNEFFVEARASGTCLLGDEAGCPAGQGGSGQDAPKTVEVPQLQFLDKVYMPVVVQRQVELWTSL